MPSNSKPCIIYVVKNYPQLSQTYIKVEIEALQHDYDIHVIAIKCEVPDVPYPTTQPYTYTRNIDEIVSIVREKKPVALHGHWLHVLPYLYKISCRTGVPYTIRGHSFDVLNTPDPDKIPVTARILSHLGIIPRKYRSLPEQTSYLINADNCLGILALPFSRPILERAGVNSNKILDCHPVVDFMRFYNRAMNGKGVMNIGACIPKKRVEDFIDLAKQMPEKTFRHYPIGYQRKLIEKYNDECGHPVEMMPHILHEDMPQQYKRHEWLVYTADRQFNTVGWPMAVAEAQASGVGVCIANIRPDLKEYVGSAGFVFDNLAQVRKIISQPFSNELREMGFTQARKSDIETHKAILTTLWESA